MGRVRCAVEAGLIDSERVARITTSDGHREEVTVADSQVDDGTLEVGLIGQTNGKVLIELPREAASGRWRVWVPASQLVG